MRPTHPKSLFPHLDFPWWLLSVFKSAFSWILLRFIDSTILHLYTLAYPPHHWNRTLFPASEPGATWPSLLAFIFLHFSPGQLFLSFNTMFSERLPLITQPEESLSVLPSQGDSGFPFQMWFSPPCSELCVLLVTHINSKPLENRFLLKLQIVLKPCRVPGTQ